MASAIPSITALQSLSVTATVFQSFATPAITVPFPSAYAQTQIAFVYSSTATWVATRIPTTIGGVAATNGVSTALVAGGSSYGQSGTGSGATSGGGGWPTWATAVIAACGGVALIVLGMGLYCWCTRKRRRQRRMEAKQAKQARLAKGFTEKQAAVDRRQNKQLRRANGHVLKATPTPLHVPVAAARPGDTYSPPPLRPPHNYPTVISYPAPVIDSYGRPVDPGASYNPRDSLDNSGYVTPTELQAPDYEPYGSDLDSPARLWAPSREATPRSSLSNTPRTSRRYYSADGTGPTAHPPRPWDDDDEFGVDEDGLRRQSAERTRTRGRHEALPGSPGRAEVDGLLYPKGDVRNRVALAQMGSSPSVRSPASSIRAQVARPTASRSLERGSLDEERQRLGSFPDSPREMELARMAGLGQMEYEQERARRRVEETRPRSRSPARDDGPGYGFAR